MIFADSLEQVEFITTGLFIDKLVGGIPRKKIFELYGDSGVGKSTLCLQIIAAIQKQGLTAVWADSEWQYDALYAKKLQVDNTKLGIIREHAGEDILTRIVEEIETGKWDLVVLDSVGHLTPRAEIEKGQEGKVIGGQAGMMARFCRGVVPLLHTKNTALLLINHSFTDIMSGAIKTSGGKKLEYARSISIRLKNKMGVVLKSGDTKVGKVIVAECKRNKVSGGEGTEVDSRFIYGIGFSTEHDRFEDELGKGIITKQGNTFFRNGVKLGVGKQKASQWLIDNKDSLV